ncbi:hypothetical protein EV361DRAFT_812744, partial [Lentinula raphanica]
YSAVAGDSGPNVSSAKRKLVSMYTWIVNIYDPCHNLNLFMKDIGALFKTDVLSTVSGLSAYFGHSNYGTAQLDEARKEKKISANIKSASETRFSTAHIQAVGVFECMPAIRLCVEKKSIKFTKKTKKFEAYVSGGNTHYLFMSKLSAFIALTTAPANAIVALEGQYIDCADVFYAWICIAWSLEHQFVDTNAGLSEYRSAIVRLYNDRFNQMMSGSSHRIFLFAYFLHPSKSCCIFCTHIANDTLCRIPSSWRVATEDACSSRPSSYEG